MLRILEESNSTLTVKFQLKSTWILWKHKKNKNNHVHAYIQSQVVTFKQLEQESKYSYVVQLNRNM